MELSQQRETERQTWRERIAAYISGQALHELTGGFDNGDDKPEGKN